MRLRSIAQLLFGIATFIPGVYKLRSKKNGSGGSYSARYCYSVFLRHMTLAKKNDFSTAPSVVAELGPGDSLGIGLMALLLGAEKYYAFDIVRFASDDKNLKMLDELIELLKKQEDIPNEIEFPRINPKLNNYKFPLDIFSKKYISECLGSKRIDRIKESIKNNSGMIEYSAPWLNEKNINAGTVNMIISQAVLEHIDDIELAYKVMFRWLKVDGFMSHSIDFKSHGKSSTWDGHWKIPNWYWFLLRGARPYLINRQPLAVHQKIMKKLKFKIVFIDRIISNPTFSNKKLNKDFLTMSNEDRKTSGVFIQVRK
jgi:SAM-dependent methyltransferase